MMLVLLATIGVLAYATFIFRPSHHGDLLPFALVVTAETWLIAQALLALWTILSSGYDPRDFSYHQAKRALFEPGQIVAQGLQATPSRWPMRIHEEQTTVDVFVTTYGEDLAVIRRTVAAALAIRGQHRTLVLDDGRSDDVRDLAHELGAEYVRRPDNHGAKAGNINHALSITDGEFFAVFDADFAPEPQFLHETLPYFATDKVAFVQTPQTYGNLHTVLSRGSGYMQSVFYSLIQSGKNRFNAAFCVGTNVVFRRNAVADIGGIYQESKSEDIWTSIHLHERGWRSIYTGAVLAVGDTPESVEAYSKQQLRWATGAFEILLRHNPLSRKRNLTTDQRIQYLTTATFYLNGIAPALLLAVPPLQIYFDLTPVALGVPTSTWLMYYAGFYFMQVVVALYTMGSFRWETLMLASSSFPIYIQAMWNAVTRRERQWHVTGSAGGARSPFTYTFPQVLVFVFLLLTTVVGAWKAEVTGSFNVALAWNALNTLVLGIFLTVTYREARTARAVRRTTRRDARRQSRQARRRRHAATAAGPVDSSPTPTTTLVGGPR
ncbi:glycosyltransferase [uncultured Nocardioides sp.]|uniref:glycosyltransferase n=1 Tax=uncultured Nocardioides sp. TaxID=198441 RepID=UPI00260B9288|nr:glycosyltransferase [uncultured Nocardioides sp.]